TAGTPREVLPFRTHFGRRDVDRRQADDELTAPVGTFAARLDATAMHLDEAPGECETDAKATAGAVVGVIELREQIEHLVELRRRNADAIGPDADHSLCTLSPHSHTDEAFRRGVLRGVVENVRKYLQKTNAIPTHIEGFGRHGKLQLMPGALDGRTARFHRHGHRILE